MDQQERKDAIDGEGCPPRAPSDAWRFDHRHSLHPFAHFESFDKDGSLIIASGSGCRVTDEDGREFVDAVGGLWCTNIGLGRDEMADAIAEQVRRLAYSPIFGDMSHPPSALLARKLAELAPGDLNRAHFVTGGSTAIDTAFRLIHFYQICQGKPSKINVIARHQSYHGSTYASISIGKRKGDRSPMFRYIQDTIHHVSAPNIYRAPDGMDETAYCDFLIDEFEAALERLGPENVGGFFAEPVMGTAGVLVPPKGYLPGIREICRQHDILYVSDEVVTAFGRLGHWFASEDVFGIIPDIICTAKGLSSGYLPIGAVIYSDRIHEAVASGDPAREFLHGFTYAGHPVCCAAALKNIEIMERESLMEHAQDVGEYFGEKLRDLAGLPLVGDVRGHGLMRCVECVADRKTKELFPDEIQIGKRIADAAEKLGLLVRPLGNLSIMSPPLVITRDEVDFVVGTLGTAIERVHEEIQADRKQTG